MHLCPLTRIFLLWWLSSYFCQEITPGPFPLNTTTTQQVHSLCSYNILHIWLHLPHNTVSTFFYVCCSNQNLNKCWIEIRLFIFTQTWPLISLPEPYSASILVFDSKYYWSAGRDAEISSTMDDLMEDTSSGTQETLPLLCMGGCGMESISWTQPSTQHLRQAYPLSWSFSICLPLVLFFTVSVPFMLQKELNFPWLVTKANSLELPPDSAPLGILYRTSIPHCDKVSSTWIVRTDGRRLTDHRKIVVLLIEKE